MALARGIAVAGAVGLALWFGHAQAAMDLNSATQSELEAVPGIGPVKAKAILDFRRDHGPFRKLDELRRVRGLGPASVARIKPYLIVVPARGKSVHPDRPTPARISPSARVSH